MVTSIEIIKHDKFQETAESLVVIKKEQSIGA